MTKTTLSREARTILRSRVRRHGQTPAGLDVAALSTADLMQQAMLLELDAPTAKELDWCEEMKATGLKGKSLYLQLDTLAANHGLGGAGMAGIVTTGMDTDFEDTPEAEDDAPAEAAPEVEAEAEAEADTEKTEAAAEVQKAMDALARGLPLGDMKPFQAILSDLAARAVHKPAPIVQQIAAIDLTKIKGHVPQITGRKNMKQAGIKALASARLDATTLDVYDAPDAPAVDPLYIWPDETAVVLSALARARNVMLWGPAGTGKTEFAKQVAAHFQRPFVRISCDDQTDANTLVGMTGLDGKGGMEWRDGQLAAAIRRPGTVVLVDEPSVARPGALFVLQACMDGDRRLHVAETGEVIPVAPGVVFILADNTNGTGDTTGQYEATRRMNRATLDRLSISFEVGYLPPDAETKLIAARTGCAPAHAAALCKFANLTRNAANGGKLSHGLGLRRVLSLAELIADGANPATAFQLSVLNTVPHDDREPLRQMWASDIPNGAFK